LDRDVFNRDLSDQSTTDEINEDLREGEMAQVGGTPIFFINGKRYNGHPDTQLT
jgi:protein-disulfide isomerase